MTTRNISWRRSDVSRQVRYQLNGHASAIVWLTGLSGAGKSTLAFSLEDRLYELGCRAYVLDGDNIRHGLCSDLGFSATDRSENIRRIGEVAALMVDAGVIAIAAFISPFRADRDRVRQMVRPGEFLEVHVQCDLATCESRDVKGLYKRARSGEVKEFTGISSPYEPPSAPELTVDTSQAGVEDCVQAILRELRSRGVLAKPSA